MKLVRDGAFEDNDGLLGMAYELIETTAEQGMYFLIRRA